MNSNTTTIYHLQYSGQVNVRNLAAILPLRLYVLGIQKQCTSWSSNQNKGVATRIISPPAGPYIFLELHSNVHDLVQLTDTRHFLKLFIKRQR